MLVLEYYNGTNHAFIICSERCQRGSPLLHISAKFLLANVKLTSRPATILRDFERRSKMMAFSERGLLVAILLLLGFHVAQIACADGGVGGGFAIKARPRSLTVYAQEIRSPVENQTVRVIANSTLGYLAVISQNLTDGVNATTSNVVGRQYGTGSSTSQIINGSYVLFFSLDNHVQTDKYKGTFLVEGGVNIFDVNQTASIVGGTGDFLGAGGHAIRSTVYNSPDFSRGTHLFEAHFTYCDDRGSEAREIR